MALINLTDEHIGLIQALADGLPAYAVREEALTSLINALADTDSVLFSVTADDVRNVAFDNDITDVETIEQATNIVANGVDFGWYAQVEYVLNDLE